MIADADALHIDESNDLLWSRANFEEAMPGVLTPLSWSFWGWSAERSSRRIYTDKLGALRPGELSSSLADTTTGLFHGRAAVNVDLLRRVLDRVPGADPDALELQVLGRVRPDAQANPTLQRLPRVLAHAPLSIALVPRRIRAMRASTDAWWRRHTGAPPPSSVPAAAALLVEARVRFTDVCTEHGFNVFVGQAGFDQLATLAAAAGEPGLELALSASGRGTEETAMIDDLWAAAAGRLSVDEVVARHGYHGPDEGEVSSWSWREDRSPLHALLERYWVSGAPRPARVADERREAERRLLAGLPRTRRAAAVAALRFVDRYLPLREVGKAAFLQCIDVGRHAAHSAGRSLVDAGVLDDVDDVRFVTVEELVSGRVDRDVIDRRADRRVDLLAVDLPDSFVGVPDSWPIGSGPVDAATDGPVRGVAASPGRHKGTARIVRDPHDYAKLDPGDVLVCELTDPGWTPLFAVAGAVVIDIGGPLSHGAIVARELGIPCVIGTGDGTRRIADGAVVEVDGDTGLVLGT